VADISVVGSKCNNSASGHLPSWVLAKLMCTHCFSQLGPEATVCALCADAISVALIGAQSAHVPVDILSQRRTHSSAQPFIIWQTSLLLEDVIDRQSKVADDGIQLFMVSLVLLPAY